MVAKINQSHPNFMVSIDDTSDAEQQANFAALRTLEEDVFPWIEREVPSDAAIPLRLERDLEPGFGFITFTGGMGISIGKTGDGAAMLRGIRSCLPQVLGAKRTAGEQPSDGLDDGRSQAERADIKNAVAELNQRHTEFFLTLSDVNAANSGTTGMLLGEIENDIYPAISRRVLPESKIPVVLDENSSSTAGTKNVLALKKTLNPVENIALANIFLNDYLARYPECDASRVSSESDAGSQMSGGAGRVAQAEQQPMTIDVARAEYAAAYKNYVELNPKRKGTSLSLAGFGHEKVEDASARYDAALKAAGERMREDVLDDAGELDFDDLDKKRKIELRERIFRELVIDEEQKICAMRIAVWPPEEEDGFWKKKWKSYARLPRWQKVAASAIVGTAIAAAAPAATSMGLLWYAGRRLASPLISGGAGSLAGMGLEGYAVARGNTIDHDVDSFVRSRDAAEKKYQDISLNLMEARLAYREILEKEADRQRNRMFVKAGVAALAGVGVAGAFHHFHPDAPTDLHQVPAPKGGGTEHLQVPHSNKPPAMPPPDKPSGSEVPPSASSPEHPATVTSPDTGADQPSVSQGTINGNLPPGEQPAPPIVHPDNSVSTEGVGGIHPDVRPHVPQEPGVAAPKETQHDVGPGDRSLPKGLSPEDREILKELHPPTPKGEALIDSQGLSGDDPSHSITDTDRLIEKMQQSALRRVSAETSIEAHPNASAASGDVVRGWETAPRVSGAGLRLSNDVASERLEAVNYDLQISVGEDGGVLVKTFAAAERVGTFKNNAAFEHLSDAQKIWVFDRLATSAIADHADTRLNIQEILRDEDFDSLVHEAGGLDPDVLDAFLQQHSELVNAYHVEAVQMGVGHELDMPADHVAPVTGTGILSDAERMRQLKEEVQGSGAREAVLGHDHLEPAPPPVAPHNVLNLRDAGSRPDLDAANRMLAETLARQEESQRMHDALISRPPLERPVPPPPVLYSGEPLPSKDFPSTSSHGIASISSHEVGQAGAIDQPALQQAIAGWDGHDIAQASKVARQVEDVGQLSPDQRVDLLASLARKVGDSTSSANVVDVAAVTRQVKDYLFAYPEAQNLGFHSYDEYIGMKDVTVGDLIKQMPPDDRLADAIRHTLFHPGWKVEEMRNGFPRRVPLELEHVRLAKAFVAVANPDDITKTVGQVLVEHAQDLERQLPGIMKSVQALLGIRGR